MINKLPISVILIAHNEANNLPRCLDSIKNWAGEIIAVINNCTDNTEQILNSYGVTVHIHNDWQGFVVQKNIALNYATLPYVFNIDADEEVSPRMKRDIEQFVHNNRSTEIAASFCRKTACMGKWIYHGDWYPDQTVRLFVRGKGKYCGNYVHEYFEVDAKIVKYKSNLLHYSYPNLEIFMHKLLYFSKIFVLTHQAKSAQISVLNIIGHSWWKFFRGYILKLGFLDGFAGLLIAVHQGYSTFFKYSLLKEAKNNLPSVININQEDL